MTADAFAALWLGVARELDDEFFGLDRRRMKAGTFGLLCRAALHGRDLGHALQRLMHGFALVFDDVAASLELVQRRAVVRIDNRIATPEARRFADETMLVMLHGVLCWLAGRRLPLLEVAFAHPRPAHADEYRSMFCQRLRFDAPCTAMVFDGRMLRAAVVQSEATLRVFLQAAPRSVFLKYRNPEGWSARLRRRLRSGLDQARCRPSTPWRANGAWRRPPCADASTPRAPPSRASRTTCDATARSTSWPPAGAA